MPSLRGLQKIFFIIIIIGAATGQRRQSQQQARDHYEIAPAHLAPQLQDYTSFFLPYAIARYPPPNEQYTFQKPTHQFKHFQQKGNGNSLAATEIAMEILRDTFPPNIEIPNDADEYYAWPSTTQKDSFDFLEKEHNNFRRSNPAALMATRRQGQEKLISKNSDWQANALGYDDNVVNDEWSATRMNYAAVPLSLDINNETVAPVNDEFESSGKAIKSSLPSLNAADIENTDGIPRSLIMVRSDNELDADKDDLVGLEKIPSKRNPLAIGDHRTPFAQPRYPYAFIRNNGGGDDKRNSASHAKLRSTKRERIRPQRTTFIPSISTGAMTHLGHFFNDLSKNVRFNERNEFREGEAKLLHGDHPLSMLQSDVADESDEQSKIDKTAELLHAIRTYRPSQKIRSLVSMNPQGNASAPLA